MSEAYTKVVLDPERIKILNSIKGLVSDGWMAGGTAIALLLGHRKSFDFDIFFTHPISQKLLVSINQSFKSRSLHPVVDTKDELSVIVDDQIKITFLFFPFTPLHPAIPLNGIPLYSFEDQASNKAYTIGRRAEWKDYVDLYALL